PAGLLAGARSAPPTRVGVKWAFGASIPDLKAPQMHYLQSPHPQGQVSFWGLASASLPTSLSSPLSVFSPARGPEGPAYPPPRPVAPFLCLGEPVAAFSSGILF
ncbi:putative Non-specific serine-threonine protein, partial [Naja naja]